MDQRAAPGTQRPGAHPDDEPAQESEPAGDLQASAAEERAALSFLCLPADMDDDVLRTLAVPMPVDRAEKEGNPAIRLGE